MTEDIMAKRVRILEEMARRYIAEFERMRRDGEAFPSDIKVAAAQCCALTEAYAIMTDRSYDEAAECLREGA